MKVKVKVAVLSATVGLATVMLLSAPVEADIPQGATCKNKRTVATGTGTTKKKAQSACWQKVYAQGKAVYGSSFWGVKTPGLWCDEDAPKQWVCVCSGYVCGYPSIKNIEPFSASKRPFHDQMIRGPRAPSRPPSGGLTIPNLRRR